VRISESFHNQSRAVCVSNKQRARCGAKKFMTKKNGILLATSVILAVVYVIYFTDWFAPKTVEIFHTYRNLRQRGRVINGEIPSLIFGINRKLKLTEIKVVPAAAFQTNQNTLPLWHLVADSNSVPIGSFSYGSRIRGMKPLIKGEHALPLATNVTYRLIVTDGKFKGEHDFELK
jgi:hypothetical protein